MALVNRTTAFLGPVNHLSKAGLLLCQAALCLAQISSLCLHLSQRWSARPLQLSITAWAWNHPGALLCPFVCPHSSSMEMSIFMRGSSGLRSACNLYSGHLFRQNWSHRHVKQPCVVGPSKWNPLFYLGVFKPQLGIVGEE